MNNLFCRLATLILILLAGLSTGCRENVLINSRVAPKNNILGVFDTSLPVITHTYYDDTAITSVNIGGIPIYQAVGAISDPYFGTMTGATYFQVIPQDNTANLFSGMTIDSVFVILPYSGFTYGDTITQSLTQTYQVFYLQSPLALDSTYYSYNSVAINSSYPLSDPTPVNIYHIKDSFAINYLPVNHAAMRIRLKNTATLDSLFIPAQRNLLNSTSPYSDFMKAFNGLCVRVSDTRQSSAAMPYFQLDGGDIFSEAGMLVYYHPTGTTDSTLIQSYHFDRTYCAHFNNVSKSYRQSPVNDLFTSPTYNDNYIALQNTPGAAVDVVIPGLNHLPKGIINKAELQLTMIDDATVNPLYYQWPEALYPIGVGNGRYPDSTIIAGRTYNLADYYPLTSTTPLTILDGTYHQMTRSNGKTYNVFTINIPREVMASIRAKNDTIHLHVNGSQDFYGAFHMVAGGGGHPDANYRPKLFVVYSAINQ